VRELHVVVLRYSCLHVDTVLLAFIFRNDDVSWTKFVYQGIPRNKLDDFSLLVRLRASCNIGPNVKTTCVLFQLIVDQLSNFQAAWCAYISAIKLSKRIAALNAHVQIPLRVHRQVNVLVLHWFQHLVFCFWSYAALILLFLCSLSVLYNDGVASLIDSHHRRVNHEVDSADVLINYGSQFEVAVLFGVRKVLTSFCYLLFQDTADHLLLHFWILFVLGCELDEGTLVKHAHCFTFLHFIDMLLVERPSILLMDFFQFNFKNCLVRTYVLLDPKFWYLFGFRR
jgi:hypothetical protein